MKAYEVLSDETKWCKRTDAIDADGNPVPANSAKAVKWCAIGALGKAYYNSGLYNSAMEILRNNIVNGGIMSWNDLGTYEEVYAKLKELDL